MNAHEAQAALSWLVEMGADEIIGEESINRFVAAAPAVVAAPVVKTEAIRTSSSSAESCRTVDDIQAALLGLEDFPLKKTASNLCFAGGIPWPM